MLGGFECPCKGECRDRPSRVQPIIDVMQGKAADCPASREDVLTDGTLEQIVAHNEIGERLCGWRP